jgi:hypothetical protein
VDWHMLRHVELQPLEVAEQRNGVGIDNADLYGPPAAGGNLPNDHDLLLREIDDRHAVAMVETFDVIELDRLVAVVEEESTQGVIDWSGRAPIVHNQPDGRELTITRWECCRRSLR